MSDAAAAPNPQRQTVAEGVYLAFKRDILTLRHAPGVSLTEQELCRTYGASRAPIREACRRLQQEGLLTSIPYKGYFVSRISVKEIRDCFDLRGALETHALALAMERARPEDLRLLEELADCEYTYHDLASYGEFLDRNLDFHMRVAALSGNNRLVATLRDLLATMQRYFFLGLELGDFGAEMRVEHQELVALMKRSRRRDAVECLRLQIAASRDRILRALAEQGVGLPME
jgi:DNA-binding GntR family transcriptional regulator